MLLYYQSIRFIMKLILIKYVTRLLSMKYRIFIGDEIPDKLLKSGLMLRNDVYKKHKFIEENYDIYDEWHDCSVYFVAVQRSNPDLPLVIVRVTMPNTDGLLPIELEGARISKKNIELINAMKSRNEVCEVGSFVKNRSVSSSRLLPLLTLISVEKYCKRNSILMLVMALGVSIESRYKSILQNNLISLGLRTNYPGEDVYPYAYFIRDQESQTFRI